MSKVYAYLSKTSLLRLWNNLCCYSISFLLAFLITRNNSLATVVVIAHFLYIRFMRRGMNFKFQPRNGIVRKSNFRSSVLSHSVFLPFFFFLRCISNFHLFALSYLRWCTILAARQDLRYYQKMSSFWRISRAR